MKKRICALLLCLLMLTAFPLTVFAAGEAPASPALTVETALSGTALTVTVGITDNPGIAGYDLALEFDTAVLTHTGAPAIAWTGSNVYSGYDLSGKVLHVCCANRENVGGSTLFTATFTVKNTSARSYGLSVYGEAYACAGKTESTVSLQPAYSDCFSVGSAGYTEDSVTADIASYGDGFSGEARAVAAWYRNGQLRGCKMQAVSIVKNGVTRLTVSQLTIPSDTDTVKLMLLDGSGRPLCAAIVPTHS